MTEGLGRAQRVCGRLARGVSEASADRPDVLGTTKAAFFAGFETPPLANIGSMPRCKGGRTLNTPRRTCRVSARESAEIEARASEEPPGFFSAIGSCRDAMASSCDSELWRFLSTVCYSAAGGPRSDEPAWS